MKELSQLFTSVSQKKLMARVVFIGQIARYLDFTSFEFLSVVSNTN